MKRNKLRNEVIYGINLAHAFRQAEGSAAEIPQLVAGTLVRALYDNVVPGMRACICGTTYGTVSLFVVGHDSFFSPNLFLTPHHKTKRRTSYPSRLRIS